MGRRQLCTYMYDVMSLSGVVVGVWHMVCGVGWVFCALPFCSLLCTNGVVQWRNHVVYNSQGPEIKKYSFQVLRLSG